MGRHGAMSAAQPDPSDDQPDPVLDARTADVEKCGLELWKNWREDADWEPELVSSSVWVTHANGADTSDSTEAIGVLPAGVHDKLVAFLLDYEGEV